MPETIVLELPEEVLINALRQLSPIRRRWLLDQFDADGEVVPHGVAADDLDNWTGIVAVGGDALTESEQLYND